MELLALFGGGGPKPEERVEERGGGLKSDWSGMNEGGGGVWPDPGKKGAYCGLEVG